MKTLNTNNDLIIFFICIFFSFQLKGQNNNVKFSHLSVDAGLSQSTAFDIVQDCYGFIWIGTYDGLNRYNGYEIEVFRTTSDTLSLPDNYIQALCIDSDGKLWVGTNSKGLCTYDYVTNKFNNLSDGSDLLPIGTSVLSLKNYNDTAIVALTEKGIHVVNIHTNKIYSMSEKEYCLLPGIPSLISYFNPLKTEDVTINCELLDSKGILWQGTDNGLKRKRNDTWSHYKNVLYDRDSLSSNEITCLIEDKGGVIWIGTSLGGICKWDRVEEGIILHKKNPIISNGLGDTKIRCFYEDLKGQIWIGTVENGVNLWDRRKNSFKHWDKDMYPSLNNNHIRDLIEYQGNYLVATDGGGVQVFFPDNKTQPFKNFKIGNLPSDAQVWDLFVDDTSLWIASYSHGLFNIRNDRVINFSDELPAIKATWITADNTGTIWIGSFGEGVFKFSPSGFECLNTSNSDLSDNRVYTVVPDERGNIWVATKTGINQISLSTVQVTAFTEQDGLPNNTVMGIICEKDSSLWLTTNFGVSHFYPNTKNIINYTIQDGLQSNEFLVHSFLQLKTGEMLFGGIQGFNVFPSKLPEPNMYLPKVVITKFTTAEGDWNSDSTIFTKSALKLSSNQNEFSIEFAALSYVEPEKNTYSYILESFDKEWKKCGNRRFVQYTNVPHGKYVFKVKAANNDKIWNDVPTELSLVISPAFWETILFKVFVVLFIVFIIWVGIRLRIRNIKSSNKILEDKVKERTSEIETTLEKLKITQNQLIHSEKMASVGVLTAGIAHEINNPVNFISAGVTSVIITKLIN